MAEHDSRRSRTVRVATYNIHRARGLDGRTRISRIAAVLASIDADIVALQEVVGASPLRPGPGGRARRGAGHGLGDGDHAAPAHGAVWQRRAEPLSDPPAPAVRPHVEDLRAAGVPARRRRARRPHAALLQRAPRHVAARAPHQAARLATLVHDRRVDRTQDRPGRLQRMGARTGDRCARRSVSRASISART